MTIPQSLMILLVCQCVLCPMKASSRAQTLGPAVATEPAPRASPATVYTPHDTQAAGDGAPSAAARNSSVIHAKNA
jgi:hypothetical protein